MEKKSKTNIIEVKGTCNSELFKKMVERGDITSYKVKDRIGDTIIINGYAFVEVVTPEKSFNMGYYSTDKGFYSTGSEVFLESVKDYFNECNKFTIMELKTKKGITYKASPVLDFLNNEE